ncbi:Uncharacterised protein [Achromobacter xylosoxidans]|nr:Uncharacterised protein [Achromobacter xylosoxidans]
MNKGAPPDSICPVRKVRFFPAPPEILKRPSATPVSGALAVVAQDPRSRSGAGRRAGQVLALQVVVGVVSSARRPPAVRRPGAGAAGGGGRGQQRAAAGGALARCRRCRSWWTWPAARCGRRRRAGQELALQVVVDVASSLKRPAAAHWPGAGAAGRGGLGQQLAAGGGGALVRCWRCSWWWTWSAACSGRWRCAGQVLALQVVVGVVSSARRPPAVRRPGAGAAGRGGLGQQLAAAGDGALARCRRRGPP